MFIEKRPLVRYIEKILAPKSIVSAVRKYDLVVALLYLDELSHIRTRIIYPVRIVYYFQGGMTKLNIILRF